MDIFELLKVVVLGIVEGITEWLPISSTGHLILVNEFIKLNVSDEFMQMFLVVIQLGAILAVVVLYFGKLWPFGYNPDEKGIFRIFDRDKWLLWFKIIVACIPAIAIGFPFDDLLEEYLYNYVVVAAMLILYGILFIIVERRNRRRRRAHIRNRVRTLNQLTFGDALLIGVFQVLALVPGTSRSGATIIGGMLLGASRTVATEFTFFLAIPVMFGASLLKVLKFGLVFTTTEMIILAVGMIVAFLVSIIAIKFLIRYISKNDFTVFGAYRILLGILVLGYFAGKTYLI